LLVSSISCSFYFASFYKLFLLTFLSFFFPLHPSSTLSSYPYLFPPFSYILFSISSFLLSLLPCLSCLFFVQ
jgi:hypothetical protein